MDASLAIEPIIMSTQKMVSDGNARGDTCGNIKDKSMSLPAHSPPHMVGGMAIAHAGSSISAAVKAKKIYKQCLDDINMNLMKTKRYATNSNKKVKWAVGTYVDWRKSCIETTGTKLYDTDILASNLEDPKLLDKY